ncbi:SDR family oxidoreductase [Endothiovibrio diazotrophicus]
MRVLITGAGGFIGGRLVRALLGAGHQVVAGCRDPRRLAARHPGAEPLAVDFSRDHDPAAWRSRLRGVDAVINTVGIIREGRGSRFDALHRAAPVALFDACVAAKVGRVVQLSALGADDSARSRYHLTKRAADRHLAGLPLHWTILRPSIVYGPGAKSSEFFRALAALPLTPLPGGGDAPLQPIHIDDLAAAVLSSLEEKAPAGRVVDLVGPRPLPLRELLDGWRRWLGLGPLRGVSVPYGVMVPAARLLGLLPGTPLSAETVAMLRRGNVADPRPMVEAFGVAPRDFSAALAESPAQTADRWHARLYLLRPLLRWSLGLLWLFTAAVSLGLYPLEESLRLAAALGLEGRWGWAALYGGALLDGALGIALLIGWRVRAVASVQIGAMVLYSALISIGLPEWWLHPFGPVTKNLPLIVATLMLMVMEER